MPLRRREFFWRWGTSFQAYLGPMDSLFRPAAPASDRPNHQSCMLCYTSSVFESDMRLYPSWCNGLELELSLENTPVLSCVVSPRWTSLFKVFLLRQLDRIESHVLPEERPPSPLHGYATRFYNILPKAGISFTAVVGHFSYMIGTAYPASFCFRATSKSDCIFLCCLYKS